MNTEDVDYTKASQTTVRFAALESESDAAAREFLKRGMGIGNFDSEFIACNENFSTETRQSAWICYCHYNIINDGIDHLVTIGLYGFGDYEDWQREAIPLAILFDERTRFNYIGIVADLWPELDKQIQEAWRVAWKRERAWRAKQEHERTTS